MTLKEKEIEYAEKDIEIKQNEIKNVIKEFKERDLWKELENKENVYLNDSLIKEMKSKKIRNLAIAADKIIELEKDIQLLKSAIAIIDSIETEIINDSR